MGGVPKPTRTPATRGQLSGRSVPKIKSLGQRSKRGIVHHQPLTDEARPPQVSVFAGAARRRRCLLFRRPCHRRVAYVPLPIMSRADTCATNISCSLPAIPSDPNSTVTCTFTGSVPENTTSLQDTVAASGGIKAAIRSRTLRQLLSRRAMQHRRRRS